MVIDLRETFFVEAVFSYEANADFRTDEKEAVRGGILKELY